MDEYENYKGDSAYGELGDLIRDLYLYSEKN